jgi:hypothetical protein
MRGKTLPFFATSKDLIDLLRPIEETEALRYVLTGGIVAGEPRPSWSRAKDIPDFGVATYGDQAGEMGWLMIPADAIPTTERVHEYSGRIRDILDQSTMPASVELRAGGLFKANILIAGSVSTISDEEWPRHAAGSPPR